MNREDDIKDILGDLSILMYRVAISNSLGMNDISVVSENFFRDLLNLVYGWDLASANTGTANAAAIDLFDESRKIAVQVTSDKSTKKIRKTIAAFVKNGFNKKCESLKIFVIADTRHARTEFDPIEGTKLETSNPFDLAKTIKNLDRDKIKTIRDFIAGGMKNRKADGAEAEQWRLMDHCKYLIDDGKAKTALDVLLREQKENWLHLTDRIKYRLLANQAVAYIRLGKEAEAGAALVSAKQFNPKDENALTNYASGLLILGKNDEAKQTAEEVIKQNPANVRAYALLVQAAQTRREVGEALSRVPATMECLPAIQFPLSVVLERLGDRDGAVNAMAKGLEAGDERDADGLTRFAYLRFQPIGEREDIRLAGRVPKELEGEIQVIIRLYEEALEKFVGTEQYESRVEIVVNLASAKALAGRKSEACDDLVAVITRFPERHEFRLHLAQFLDSPDRIATYLEPFKDTKKDIRGSMMLAEALVELHRKDDAIDLYRRIARDASIDGRHRIAAHCMWGEILLERSDLASVAKVIDELAKVPGSDLARGMLSADVLLKERKVEESIEALKAASKLLRGDDHGFFRHRLALRLHRARQYDDAASMLTGICNGNPYHPWSRQLLDCLYQSGRRKEALELAEKMVGAGTGGYFPVEVILAIHETLGDLRSAKDACERFLERDSSAIPARVRLATINQRLGDIKAVDAFLDEDHPIDTFDIEDGIRCAQLNISRGRGDRALDSVYELCRRRPRSHDAHKAFFKMFLLRDEDRRFDVSVVDRDLWCACEMSDGTKVEFIIEDRKPEEIRDGERALRDSIVQKILGKMIGETALIREYDWDKVVCTIVDLKNKFVRLFQEIGDKSGVWFPDEDGVLKIQIPDLTTGGGIPDVLKRILEGRSEARKQAEQLHALYTQRNLTVGCVASALNLEAYEALEYLIGNGVGIQCCGGRPDEYLLAARVLSGKRRLVLDVTSIFTINLLGIGAAVAEALRGRLVTGQGTIDALKEYKSKCEFERKKESTAVWHEDGKYYKHSSSKEDLKRHADHVGRAVSWATEHCEVIPRRGALNRPADKVKELDELLGREFAEVLFIADDVDGAVWSDDFALRALGMNDFRVPGVWTKPVLDYLAILGRMEQETRLEGVATLARCGYAFIDIDAAVLLAVLKNDGFMATEGFKKAARFLGGKYSHVGGAARVVADVFMHLWKEPVAALGEDAIVSDVLSAFHSDRNDTEAGEALRLSIDERFKLLPSEHDRWQQLLTRWVASRHSGILLS